MKKTMKLASRGKRFLAALIDAALPVAAYIIMMSAMGVSVLSPNGNNGYGYGYGDPFDYGYGYEYNYNYNVPSRAAGMLVGFLGFALLAYIIVEFIFYSKAKSIGKAILGLQVVSSTDGKPFRFWKMVLRECVVKGASSSVFGLGYIWVLIDERNRAWHDKILDSYVVDLKETEMMYKRAADAARAEVMPVAKPAPKEEAMALPVAKPAEVRPFDAPDEEAKPAEAPNEEVKPVEASTEEARPAEAQEGEPAIEAKPVEPPIEEAIPAEASTEDAKPAEEAQAAPAPVNASMAMSRSELLELAARLGVDVSSGATKPELVEEINKAAGGSR